MGFPTSLTRVSRRETTERPRGEREVGWSDVNLQVGAWGEVRGRVFVFWALKLDFHKPDNTSQSFFAPRLCKGWWMQGGFG